MGLVEPETCEKWTPSLFPNVPGLARAYRTFLFCLSELEFYLIFTGKPAATKFRRKMEAKLLQHMKGVVPEQYQEILILDYSVG